MSTYPTIGRPAHERDTSRLLRRYHRERRADDLEELVRRYRPLARNLALRYARGSDPVDDLEQVANVGLVKAISRFDPDRGFAFTSFAVPTILGELKRFLRDTVWSARVPRALQERVAEVRAAAEVYTAQTGRSPTLAELAIATGHTVEEVLEATSAAEALTPSSMDAPSGHDEDSGISLVEQLGRFEDGYELVEDREAIQRALPELSDRQRLIFELRFKEDITQREIAARVGISQMQVSRVLRTTLETLRAGVERPGAAARGRAAG